MRSRVLATLAATAIALAPAVPASAYDTLRGIVSVLPDLDDADSAEFNFMSPVLQQGWDARDWVGIGLMEAEMAAFDPGPAIGLVGIDFSQLDGLAHWGEPPSTFVYLIGELDPGAVRDALLNRPNMEEVPAADVIGELPDDLLVLSEGEDYATDFGARDEDYPFGGGWRAHRIAVGEAAALVAFAWPDFELALEATLDPSTTERQQMWSALVDAAATASPSGLDAYSAAAVPPRFYTRPADQGAGDAAQLPPFDAVMVLGAVGDGWEAAQFALAYGEVAGAEAAATALAERLPTANPPIPANAKVATHIGAGDEDVVTAVVSVVFASGTSEHRSSEWVQRWINDVYSGRLEVMLIAGE